MQKLEQEEGEGAKHPLSISNIKCFDEYEKIRQTEFISTMLMAHLADRYLAPTGYMLYCGSKEVLHGQKTAAPL